MADLHTLSLLFRDGQRQVNLIYNSESAARANHYGTEIVLVGQPLEAVILQNNGKAHEGGVEMALLQARAQALAERRAASDPMLGKRMVQVGQPGFKM